MIAKGYTITTTTILCRCLDITPYPVANSLWSTRLRFPRIACLRVPGLSLSIRTCNPAVCIPALEFTRLCSLCRRDAHMHRTRMTAAALLHCIASGKKLPSCAKMFVHSPFVVSFRIRAAVIPIGRMPTIAYSNNTCTHLRYPPFRVHSNKG